MKWLYVSTCLVFCIYMQQRSTAMLCGDNHEGKLLPDAGINQDTLSLYMISTKGSALQVTLTLRPKNYNPVMTVG